jgi:23S rRNA maturation mini-RNase III
MNRKMPEFKPLPPRIRGVRYEGPECARFYGLYKTKQNKTKPFRFHVEISDKISNKTKGKLIRDVCGHLLDNEIPIHKRGQTFNSFKKLNKTGWINVKEILEYEAGIEYAR